MKLHSIYIYIYYDSGAVVCVQTDGRTVWVILRCVPLAYESASVC